MTRRWAAPAACACAAAMSLSSQSRAGVWGTEPILGLAGDYASNPVLINVPDTEETHGAVLLDAPTTYTGDAFKLSILPAVRLGNNEGYSSLDSDYEHLNAQAEFDASRNIFTATAGVNRDSSIAIFAEPSSTTVAYNGLLDGKIGVARTSEVADLDWDRRLTERADFSIDANTSRIRYDQPNVAAADSGGPLLTGYTYTSISPTLSWATSERSKISFGGTVGRYNSTTGESTESSSGNLQLGIIRQLSELWSLSATAGYSREIDKVDVTEEFLEPTSGGYEIVEASRNLESSENGSVYSVNLSRQTDLLLLSLAASRQLVPSGSAFLSRQSSYALTARYTVSARWTLNGTASWVEYQSPTLGEVQNPVTLVTTQYTASNNVTSGYVSLSSVWQWTERWSVTLGASYVTEKPSPNVDLSSTGVSIKLSRKFNRIAF